MQKMIFLNPRVVKKNLKRKLLKKGKKAKAKIILKQKTKKTKTEIKLQPPLPILSPILKKK